MSQIQSEIIKFIQSAKAATVCGAENNEPYCFSCLYTYAELESEPVLIFKSSENSSHVNKLMSNEKVAGSILPDKVSLTNIRGIQFKGRCRKMDIDSIKAAKEYYIKYPVALGMKGSLWIILLDEIKYTDNRLLGLGKKIIWQRDQRKNN